MAGMAVPGIRIMFSAKLHPTSREAGTAAVPIIINNNTVLRHLLALMLRQWGLHRRECIEPCHLLRHHQTTPAARIMPQAMVRATTTSSRPRRLSIFSSLRQPSKSTRICASQQNQSILTRSSRCSSSSTLVSNIMRSHHLRLNHRPWRRILREAAAADRADNSTSLRLLRITE